MFAGVLDDEPTKDLRMFITDCIKEKNGKIAEDLFDVLHLIITSSSSIYKPQSPKTTGYFGHCRLRTGATAFLLGTDK